MQLNVSCAKQRDISHSHAVDVSPTRPEIEGLLISFRIPHFLGGVTVMETLAPFFFPFL
jgi:hypothetical protein